MPPVPPVPEVPATAAEDSFKLTMMLHNYGVADLGSWMVPTSPIFAYSPIVCALRIAGVTTWTGLMSLDVSQINGLSAPRAHTAAPVPPGAIQPLLIHEVNLLRAFIAFYHHFSRQRGSCIRTTLTEADFNRYRIGRYNPNTPPIPFGLPSPHALTTEEKQVAEWKRNTRPSSSSYTTFKDETNWQTYKEDFESLVQQHNLEDTIADPSAHIVRNTALDEMQCKWIFGRLEENFKHPKGRAIIKKHKKEPHRTRDLWKELCEAYDVSMAATLNSGQLNEHIVTTNFHDQAWKGSQVSQIEYYCEIVRRHSEVARRPYDDAQLVDLLRLACLRTPNLEAVYNRNIQSRRAAKDYTDPNFAELKTLLLGEAELYDKSRSNRKGLPRTANVHDFEETEYVEEYYGMPMDGNDDYDMDTPLEVLMATQNRQSRFKPKSNRPKKVFMNKKTWESLVSNDKASWDKISEARKEAILEYVKNRAESSRKTLPQLTAKTHESTLVFDEDHEDQTEETIENNDTSITVGMHESIEDPQAMLEDDPLSRFVNDSGPLEKPSTYEAFSIARILADNTQEKEDGTDISNATDQETIEIQLGKAKPAYSSNMHDLSVRIKIDDDPESYEVNVSRRELSEDEVSALYEQFGWNDGATETVAGGTQRDGRTTGGSPNSIGGSTIRTRESMFPRSRRIRVTGTTVTTLPNETETTGTQAAMSTMDSQEDPQELQVSANEEITSIMQRQFQMHPIEVDYTATSSLVDRGAQEVSLSSGSTSKLDGELPN